jgi:hypothetical protein
MGERTERMPQPRAIVNSVAGLIRRRNQRLSGTEGEPRVRGNKTQTMYAAHDTNAMGHPQIPDLVHFTGSAYEVEQYAHIILCSALVVAAAVEQDIRPFDITPNDESILEQKSLYVMSLATPDPSIVVSALEVETMATLHNGVTNLELGAQELTIFAYSTLCRYFDSQLSETA